ncbi:glutathione peroxidase [Pontibacter sp. BT310]|jgi:glutathione peroxidase|uniref:Glutathione peroxidase n=1 Tax=Pontibacter populi TaxID=890055 RepID=A0ABS6XCK7_9BACT|nr:MULTISPECIES: glutathione peroxidase [Pontibacter]MBJ6118854.1 glutathione peroxidase [Pontibacter sp. BT310]MBW3365708.1 glutathione peroxidase [Pontibacter populi]
MKKLVKLLSLLPVLGMMVACSGNNNSNTATANTTTNKTMATETQTQQGFYDFKLSSLEGKEVNLSDYKGKKVLLVNTASECGYTPQYADLEQLHDTHGDKVVILGFPANNFGGQEPGSNEEIAQFCQKNYGVSFQMMEKISVVGEDKHPLYAWLAQNAPNHEEPNWNFCKYLVNEEGKVVAFFPSKVKPMGEEIVMAIQQ